MTKQFRKFLMAGAAGAAVMLAQAGAVHAQAITGGLHAKITANDGAPVAGASVKLVSEATGSSIDLNTDSTGSFTVQSLSVQSAYTVTISAPGFETKTLRHVGLLLGSTANLQIDLSTIQAETVVVTGQHAPNTGTTLNEARGVATTFDATDIRNTPSLDRDFKEIVQKTPYAYIDPVGGGSNPPAPTTIIAGTSPRCSNFLVDGLQQKDNFGLNLTGYPTNRSPIPTDWASNIEVAVTAYDVQYNDSCGGVTNVVTKSGGNTWHGSVYGYFKDQSLNGDDYAKWDPTQGKTVVTGSSTSPTPLKPHFSEKSYGGTLSGAIIEDTLFFFVGYDELKRTTQPSALNAYGPAGSGYPLTVAGITQAQVDQIAADAKSVYGFNAGSFGDNFTEYNQRYLAKMTWQITNGQALTATYQHAGGAQLVLTSQTNNPVTKPLLTLPSNWYANNQKMEVYNLQETGHWSSNFSTEFSIGHEGVREVPTPLDGLNFPEVYVQTPGLDGNIATIGDNGYVRLGPDYSRQYNQLRYKNDYLKALATYTIDEHTFEGGIEYHHIASDDKFIQGAQSVVRFDSESDFKNGIISQNVNTATAGVAASSSAISGFPVYLAAGYNGTGVSNSSADGIFNYGLESAFLQDTFYPIPDATVQMGMRYDRYVTNPNVVTPNPYFMQRYGFTNTATISGMDDFLPRISANYNFTPDQDFIPNTLITLRGGAGEYSGGFQTVWIINDYDTTGINTINAAGIPGKPIGSYMNVQGGSNVNQIVSFTGVPTILPTDHQAWLQDLINGPLGTVSAVKTSSVDAQLPSFRPPKTLRMNASFDILFGDGWLGPNWTFTFDYLNMNTLDAPYWTNLRLVATATPAPDGRKIYAYKYDGTVNKDPVTNGALTGSDYGMGSMDGGNSTLFIASVKNQWKDTGYGDFGLTIGYTHEQSSDVSSETSSTAGSNYGNVARTNFNDPEVGTSDYERVHRATMNLDIAEKFLGNMETRLNIFAQMMSGQHYSLIDKITSASGQSPFGPSGTSGNSLMYVPKVDPTTGLVTATSDPIVTYVGGFNFAQFNTMLEQTGAIKYAGKIVPRNSASGPWSSLVNLSVEQEIAPDWAPVLDDSHRVVVSLDIFNFLNLLNPAWGAYTSPNFYQAFEAVDASIVGGKYLYSGYSSSNPSSSININNNFTTQRTQSTYQIALGVRYEF